MSELSSCVCVGLLFAGGWMVALYLSGGPVELIENLMEPWRWLWGMITDA